MFRKTTIRSYIFFISCCSLTCVFTLLSMYTHLSFRHCDFNYGWNRFDQGNLLASSFWGCICFGLISGFIIRYFGSKYPIILSHLWISYFALYYSKMTTAYYEFWANEYFTSLSYGIIILGVIQLLITWIPLNELPYRIAMLLGCIGLGNIVGYGISWIGIVYFDRGLYCLYIIAILSFIISILWYSSKITDSPFQNNKISDNELAYLKSHPSIKTTKIYSFDNIYWNWEALRLSIASFCYGYVLFSLITFHSILYYEASSLQSVLQDVPFEFLFPWVFWIIASFIVAFGSHYNLSLPYFKNLYSKSMDHLAIEAIFLILSAIVFWTMPSHSEVIWINIRICPLYFYFAVSFISFIYSHVYCKENEPILQLGLSWMLLGVGGATSVTLGSLILEMSGSWRILFSYQRNICLFNAIITCLIPWIYFKFYKQTTIKFNKYSEA